MARASKNELYFTRKEVRWSRSHSEELDIPAPLPCLPARRLKEPAEEDGAESCTGSLASVGAEQRRDVAQEVGVLKVMQMTRALEGTVEGSGLCGA